MRTFPLFAATLLAASFAQGAGITNGGFEAGLTGWTVSGNVFPTASPTSGLVNILNATDWNGFVPQEGNLFAELSNSPLANDPPIQDFSKITSGMYLVSPGVNASISFLYNLLTNEFDNGLDYAEFRVNGVLVQKYLVSAIPQSGGCPVTDAAPDFSTVCVESGWILQSFSLSPFEGQNVNFSFGIFDAFGDPLNTANLTTDNGFDSVLLLDSITATGLQLPQAGVPEPSTLLLMAVGLLGTLVRLRLKVRQP